MGNQTKAPLGVRKISGCDGDYCGALRCFVSSREIFGWTRALIPYPLDDHLRSQNCRLAQRTQKDEKKRKIKIKSTWPWHSIVFHIRKGGGNDRVCTRDDLVSLAAGCCRSEHVPPGPHIHPSGHMVIHLQLEPNVSNLRTWKFHTCAICSGEKPSPSIIEVVSVLLLLLTKNFRRSGYTGHGTFHTREDADERMC